MYTYTGHTVSHLGETAPVATMLVSTVCDLGLPSIPSLSDFQSTNSRRAFFLSAFLLPKPVTQNRQFPQWEIQLWDKRSRGTKVSNSQMLPYYH